MQRFGNQHAKASREIHENKIRKILWSVSVFTLFCTRFAQRPNFRPMNLTLPSPDVLPNGIPHFFNAVSISPVPNFSAKKETFNYRFISSVSHKDISLFLGLNFNTTTNVAEFAECCQSVSQNSNTARRIFFRTRPFKTSDELLSMATGLCSVRVKNKATSEATLLQYVNFWLSGFHSLPQK